MSGFFLARHVFEVGWWQKEVVKRVRSLVIPFYVWTVIMIIFGWMIWYTKTFVLGNSEMTPLDMSPCEYLLFLIGLHPFKDIGHLWYVRCLFFLVIVSPLIVSCCVRRKQVLVGLFCLHLLFSCLFGCELGLSFYFLFDRYLSVRGLFYFCLGMFLCMQGSSGFYSIVSKIRKMKGFVLLVGCMFLVLEAYLRLVGIDIVARVVEVVTVPILLFGVFDVLPSWNLPKWLLRNSFPLFLMHNIFLSVAAFSFILIGIHGNGNYDVLMMFFRSVIAITASIFVAEILRKFFPNVAKSIFGGR